MKNYIPANALALLLLLALAACTKVGPDYQPPAPELPEAWQAPVDPALALDSVAPVSWWTLFDDPLLHELILLAEQENHDLAVAVARVEEARALLAAANGGKLPSVEAAADASRQRFSEDPGPGGTASFYGVSVSAAWEIDLFGRIARNIEAAGADLQAGEEDQRFVAVALYANVALEYINLRTFQAGLEAAHANIRAQMEVLDLTRARARHGLGSELDVAQAQRILESTKAELPVLNAGLARARNNLALLTGRPPGSLDVRLADVQPIPEPTGQSGLGLPADLLRQRPDIRAAERRLAAQTARIGVATADLYPSFTLTGRFGFEAGDAGNLLESSSSVFGFGPSIRWNLFAGGRIKALIEAEDARARQALHSYEATVLAALHEVENALHDYVNEQDRLEALARSITASKRTVELATRLYKEGLTGFQPVLDAQQALFDFESRQATARGNSAAHFVRIYAALGGGWNHQTGSAPQTSDSE